MLATVVGSLCVRQHAARCASGSLNFTPTTSWTRYSFSFVVTSATNFIMKLWGKKQFTGNSGSVDYDRIQVEFLDLDIPSSDYLTTFFDGSQANCYWAGTATNPARPR